MGRGIYRIASLYNELETLTVQAAQHYLLDVCSGVDDEVEENVEILGMETADVERIKQE